MDDKKVEEDTAFLALVIGFIVVGMLLAGFCYWRKRRNANKQGEEDPYDTGLMDDNKM